MAYQVSKSVHAGEIPVPNRDNSITMAALLSQMEYGDWSALVAQKPTPSELGEVAEVGRDAVLLFCPRKMTHLALDHDLASLQQQLEAKWEGLDGMTREACAKRYVEAVQDLDRYGITSFQAEVSSARGVICVRVALVEGQIHVIHSSTTCYGMARKLSIKNV